MTSEPPGRLYSAVTKHWPKIALGSIGAAVGAGFMFGRIAGMSFQPYVFAWAALTAGFWFLFDRAEVAVSGQSRKRVVAWLGGDATAGIQSIPHQFALLFDSVFGERHWSWKCFRRSAVASLLSVLMLFGIYLSISGSLGEKIIHSWRFLGGDGSERVISTSLSMGYVEVVVFSALNVLPDFLSLLQTRWVLRLLEKGQSWALVLADAVLTGIIAGAAYVFFQWSVWGVNQLATVIVVLAVLWTLRLFWRRRQWTLVVLDLVRTTVIAGVAFGISFGLWYLGFDFASVDPRPGTLFEVTAGLMTLDPQTSLLGITMGVFFYSTFLTSVWLWLYAASVMLSRVLLRMNNGVGFLLRATDVERQPFRSMGFVSVIIVSVLFAMGLPLVLL